MAIITEGLYRVILEMSYRGQNILNTYFYENSLGNDDEQELCAQAFDEDVLIHQAPCQHNSLIYTAIRVQNVTGNLADFVRTPSLLNGTLVGAALNTFTAAGIRLNRTTKDTRNGQKRIAAGIEEHAETQNWDATYIALLETLGTALADQISTVGGIFNPVIARQEPLTPTNWVVNPVASHTVKLFITSQVSRKA